LGPSAALPLFFHADSSTSAAVGAADPASDGFGPTLVVIATTVSNVAALGSCSRATLVAAPGGSRPRSDDFLHMIDS
jgi:hypothetical protein